MHDDRVSITVTGLFVMLTYKPERNRMAQNDCNVIITESRSSGVTARKPGISGAMIRRNGNENGNENENENENYNLDVCVVFFQFLYAFFTN